MIDEPPNEGTAAAPQEFTAAPRSQNGDAVECVRQLAEQVVTWHNAGRWHGGIGAEVPTSNELGSSQLSDPGESIRLGDSSSDWDRLPLELHRVLPVELPSDISLTRERLKQLAVSLDPCAIDIYGLGTLLCRCLTGEFPAAFVRSPRVRQLVPEDLRSIIDRALQPATPSAYATAAELVEALGRIRIMADSRDTTPSFVSSASKADDTSVGRRRPSAPPDSGPQPNDSEAAPLPFTRLGHYDIVARLGHGGMGDVYLAYERALDRRVAIKVLPSDLARSDEFVRRFRAEATAAARLIHPNIIQIHFIGEDAGQHYFVMQYVAGESLAGLLARRGKLDVDETLAIAEQALSGLAAAHERGMVHRDIKPGNILLDARHHRALLADFGLVKSLESSATGKTATGVVMGTVDYISPEQGRGQAVDGRSDLYSLGVLLYQMLSGRLPFQADNPTALVFQHVYETAPALSQVAPEVPSPLASIIEKLLAKAPADRYQSAAELLADLRAFRARQSAAATMDAPDFRQTTIVRLPTFDDLALARVDDVSDVAPHGWWQWAGDRALSIFRRHAPEALQQLQNTQQQVDGAIANYERRHRMLDGLALEARAVLEELQKQSQDQWDAARAAAQRAEASSDAADRERACDEQAACELAAAELDHQIADQRAQLEPVQLRLAQLQAGAAELRNQRDILNARLKSADARAKLHGGGSRRRLPNVPGLVLAATMCIAAVVFLLNRLGKERRPSQSESLVSNRAPVEKEPQTKEAVQDQRAGLLTGLKAAVNFAAFAPVRAANGSHRFATANADGSVGLYQVLVNGNVIPPRPLAGHLKAVNSLAFSPDATRLAAASEDGTVSVWDLPQHREIRRLSGHTGPVTVIAFSADGSQILSAGRYGFARLWDVQSETEVKQIKLNEPRTWPGSLAWAPDGERFLIGARLSGAKSASILSLEKQSEQVILAGVTDLVSNAAFTRDGSRIVGVAGASYPKSLVVWDADTGKELTTLATGFAAAAAFTPDGSRALLEKSRPNALEVWDVLRGEVIATFQHEHNGPLVLAVSSDGTKGLSIGAEGSLRVRELPPVPSPERQLQLFHAGSPVECVAFSPDGYLGVSGDADAVRFWNFESPNIASAYAIENPVSVVAFSPDNDRVLYATGQTSSTANFVGMRMHEITGPRRFQQGQRDQRRFQTSAKAYTAAVFFDAGRQVATANADGTIRTWDIQTETNRQTGEVGVPVNGLAVLGDGARALLAVNDNDLRVWDWKEKHEVGRLKGHTFHVYCVATSVDGKVAVSGGGDRTVRVWDVETREPIAVLAGHTARINSVSVSPYGKFILSGSDDGTVRLWKADAPNALLILQGHVGPVRTVALSPDATRALSGGADGTVRLWDLASAIAAGDPRSLHQSDEGD